jgi:hypothetical protein
MPTIQIQFRLQPAEIEHLTRRAKEWGGVRELTKTDVIRELIKRDKERDGRDAKGARR